MHHLHKKDNFLLGPEFSPPRVLGLLEPEYAAEQTAAFNAAIRLVNQALATSQHNVRAQPFASLFNVSINLSVADLTPAPWDPQRPLTFVGLASPINSSTLDAISTGTPSNAPPPPDSWSVWDAQDAPLDGHRGPIIVRNVGGHPIRRRAPSHPPSRLRCDDPRPVRQVASAGPPPPTSVTLCPRQFATFFRIAPSDDVLADVLSRVVRHFRWSK
jgi:hypothetical protein